MKKAVRIWMMAGLVMGIFPLLQTVDVNDGQQVVQAGGDERLARLAAAPVPGRAAPDFSLRDAQGREHRLSDWRGKPVFINFWASWCQPCQEELPELARAAKEMEGQVQFLGVNLAARDSLDVARALLQRHSVTYPNVYDQRGTVADLYRVFVIPTSVLLDGEGKVIARFQGPVTGAQIAEQLQRSSKKR